MFRTTASTGSPSMTFLALAAAAMAVACADGALTTGPSSSDASSGPDSAAVPDSKIIPDGKVVAEGSADVGTTGTADRGTGTDSAAQAPDSAAQQPDSGVAADGGGASVKVHHASSCSRADVQAAIDGASDGETVSVPAGSCAWSGAVSINSKTIALVGAGSASSAASGGTEIRYAGAGHSLLEIDAGAKTGRVDISGFRFVGGDANYWHGQHINFSGPDKWRNLRIHHNAFVDSVNAAVRGGTAVEGLIDNNRFEGNTFGIQFDGRGSADWSVPAPYGTAGFFFVEDNTFDVVGGSRPAQDVMNGGRLVFRHNTLTNAYFQVHDRCRSGLPSARAFEVYGNAFNASSNSAWKAIDLSAGGGVIYNNTFDAMWSVAIGAYQAREGSCNLPPSEELGAVDPVHTWNNNRAGQPHNQVNCTSSAAECAEMTFVEGTPQPGYSPYAYPHPLAAP